MTTIDHDAARALLSESFFEAEAFFLDGQEPIVQAQLAGHLDVVFSSSTQAYREVLLGCAIARIVDPSVDIHLPYVSHGPCAFNGRDLDESVVNPFLQQNRVPCTRGPYLSTFRRQVRFEPSTREGLRDKEGYDSLLQVIDVLASTSNAEVLRGHLVAIAFRFVRLREAAIVPLTRIRRLSLPQFRDLLLALSQTPSGGLFPLLIVVAALNALREVFDLPMTIRWQPINAADVASGAEGDVTVHVGDVLLTAIEITERPIDRARLVATFNTKIAPAQVPDYLFLHGPQGPHEDALAQAATYFAQGHEVNFAPFLEWTTQLLTTVGPKGRELFNEHFMHLLDSPQTPRSLKVAWNTAIEHLFARPSAQGS